MKQTHEWLLFKAGSMVHAYQLAVDGKPIPSSLCGRLYVKDKEPVGRALERMCPACAKRAKALDEREAFVPSEACVKAGRILNKVFGGLHHVNVIKDFGFGAEVLVYGGLSTWDFNKLTELVVAAHDDCVRVEIEPANFHDLRLIFHPRDRSATDSTRRHPTMEEALDTIRKRHAAYDAGFDEGDPVKYVKGHSRRKR